MRGLGWVERHMLMKIHRAGTDCVQLGRCDVVRRQRSLVPSVPVLQVQGEGRHQAGAGADGEEAREHRGEEGGEKEAEGGVREAGGAEEGGGGEEEELGVLVSKESQVLVRKGRGWWAGGRCRSGLRQLQVQVRGREVWCVDWRGCKIGGTVFLRCVQDLFVLRW